MKKIIICILLHIVTLAAFSALHGSGLYDDMFDTPIELGFYSRGGVHTDARETTPFPSEYSFFGKVIKYKFTVSEKQDVAIHHFGSEMKNASKIYLFKLLEPRVKYEYFENGRILLIGTANEWNFIINNQEYDRESAYYQTNYQAAQNRYIQHCSERGLSTPNIKEFQPFLFADGLEKGTYYIISEGYAWKYMSGYIYLEDGILSTTVMYGNRSNPEAVKEETDIGKYSNSFSYKDISRPSDYKEGAALHKFEITTPMDITISHALSPTHTSIVLQDDNNKEIATSANSPSPYVTNEGEDQTTLYKQHLSPGIYHIISASDDVDEYIHISVRGYATKIGSQEEPLALTSLKNYVYTITPTVPLPDVSNITLDQSLQKIVYYDGLGRLEQEISRGASPSKQDLVSFQEYDSYGRKSILWNPVPIGGSGQAYAQEDIAFHSPNVYQDAYPKSATLYELSPLDRISEQYGAGEDWHKNRRTIKTSYLSNVAGIDSLNATYYTITDICDTVMKINHCYSYETAQLSVTRIQDEDGAASFEFKNKLDQTILIRQIQYTESGKDFYDTYYIYDKFGNLRAVLPPLACDQMENGTFTSNVDNALKDYAYLYQYDDRNRCIAKKLPGCDWSFYIYDKADHLIFSQNGNQRKKGDWFFSIPDRFGRECISGICKDTLSPFSNPLKNVVVKADRQSHTPSTIENGLYKGYYLSGVSLVSPTVLLVNYYDDYSFLGKNGFPDATDSNVNYEISEESNGFGIRYANSDKGLLTGTLTAVLNNSESPSYLYSVMYYDYWGRLTQSKTANHLGGMEKEYFAYSFIGNLTQRKHVHSAMNKSTQVELYTYTYDHAGRLLTTAQQLNDGIPVTLVSNSYDELGRLKSNERNGNPNLKTEYTYNIRSWTKNITSPLFNESLYYNDQRSNGTNSSLYNGNISGIDWSVENDKERGYDFSYDGFSRLTGASYLEGNIPSDKFNTSYSYDKHGNMLSLSRQGNVGTSTYGIVDDLTLVYNGNQLVSIEDAGTNPSLSMSMDFKDAAEQEIEYAYDANGNQTKDLNKGISGIEYNILNLPKRITFSIVNNPVNEYVYSAGGKKLAVIHKSSTEKRTDYVGNMIYENGSLKRILVDGGYIENGIYHFYLQDHLGNNRVVAKFDGTVVQTNHYYPYGMSFAEGTFADKQPYKYNGKELDTENGLNLYDYDARQMDVVSGRFTSIDPMAEKYYSWSPYTYCLNNPVNRIDPTGMASRYNWETERYEDEDGNEVEWQKVQKEYGLGDGEFSKSDAVNWFFGSLLSLIGMHPKQMNSEDQVVQMVASQKRENFIEGLNTFNECALSLIPGGDVAYNYWNNSDVSIGDYAWAAVGIIPLGKAGKVAGTGAKVLFKFTGKAASRMEDAGRMIPIQILDDIIRAPMYVRNDPQGTKALMHYSQMWKNSKLYNVEVLYDNTTNTIMHFKYTESAMGPLKKIIR